MAEGDDKRPSQIPPDPDDEAETSTDDIRAQERRRRNEVFRIIRQLMMAVEQVQTESRPNPTDADHSNQPSHPSTSSAQSTASSLDLGRIVQDLLRNIQYPTAAPSAAFGSASVGQGSGGSQPVQVVPFEGHGDVRRKTSPSKIPVLKTKTKKTDKVQKEPGKGAKNTPKLDSPSQLSKIKMVVKTDCKSAKKGKLSSKTEQSKIAKPGQTKDSNKKKQSTKDSPKGLKVGEKKSGIPLIGSVKPAAEFIPVDPKLRRIAPVPDTEAPNLPIMPDPPNLPVVPDPQENIAADDLPPTDDQNIAPNLPPHEAQPNIVDLGQLAQMTAYERIAHFLASRDEHAETDTLINPADQEIETQDDEDVDSLQVDTSDVSFTRAEVLEILQRTFGGDSSDWSEVINRAAELAPNAFRDDYEGPATITYFVPTKIESARQEAAARHFSESHLSQLRQIEEDNNPNLHHAATTQSEGAMQHRAAPEPVQRSHSEPLQRSITMNNPRGQNMILQFTDVSEVKCEVVQKILTHSDDVLRLFLQIHDQAAAAVQFNEAAAGALAAGLAQGGGPNRNPTCTCPSELLTGTAPPCDHSHDKPPVEETVMNIEMVTTDEPQGGTVSEPPPLDPEIAAQIQENMDALAANFDTDDWFADLFDDADFYADTDTDDNEDTSAQDGDQGEDFETVQDNITEQPSSTGDNESECFVAEAQASTQASTQMPATGSADTEVVDPPEVTPTSPSTDTTGKIQDTIKK